MKNGLWILSRMASLVGSGLVLIAGPAVALGCGAAAGSGPSDTMGEAATRLKSCPGGAIDDFEDGNGQSSTVGGRGGYWYTYSDKGSTVSPGSKFAPAPGGAGGSKFAARMTGKTGGEDVTYAGMGFSFVDPKGPYDATAYRGVRFKAKAAKGSVKDFRVKIPDVNTVPEGKVCKQCYNDFGADLSLSEDWQTFTIPFESTRQETGWGDQKAAITTKQLYGFMVQVKEPNSEFDIAVDDIEFVCK